MKDTYLNFVNSPFGARLARSVGLPKPEVLRRYRADQPEFDGLVPIGAGREPHLLDALAGGGIELGAVGHRVVACALAADVVIAHIHIPQRCNNPYCRIGFFDPYASVLTAPQHEFMLAVLKIRWSVIQLARSATASGPPRIEP